jgi:hypothetical protein
VPTTTPTAAAVAATATASPSPSPESDAVVPPRKAPPKTDVGPVLSVTIGLIGLVILASALVIGVPRFRRPLPK